MRKKLIVILSMLCLILCNQTAVSANEVSKINQRNDMLAFEFLIPAVIIIASVGGLILYEYIRRRRNNRDKLF